MIFILSMWLFYLDAIQHLQDKLQALIIPAILEHEAISGLTSHKPAGKHILA